MIRFEAYGPRPGRAKAAKEASTNARHGFEAIEIAHGSSLTSSAEEAPASRGPAF